MAEPMTNAVITSKDNRYVKLARSMAVKKQREAAGLFLAEGINNVREALQSAFEPAFLLFDAERANEPRIAELLRLARAKSCPAYAVAGSVLQSVSPAETSQGLLLAVKLPRISSADFAKQAAGRSIALLDGLQDPGNVGTILRTAWAAGLSGVLLVNGCADAFAPKVVRAAMGALYHLPVLACANETAEELLAELKLPLWAADAGGENFRRVSAGSSVCWLLGREAAGPSFYWRERAAKTVAIPMQPGVDSLNVAVAAGILFFSGVEEER